MAERERRRASLWDQPIGAAVGPAQDSVHDQPERPVPVGPSVGRIVHYVSFGTPNGEYMRECRAAIITAVDDRHHGQQACLAVMTPTGVFFNQWSTHAEADKAGGTWHWPERAGA